MKRLAILAVLGVALTYCYNSSFMSAADKDPSIKEIMHKVNDKGGLLAEINTGVKGGKWDDALPKSKELVTLAKAMAKQTPPKGEMESWEKLSKGYLEASEKLEKAVADKDEKAVATSQGAIKACGACHKLHKK